MTENHTPTPEQQVSEQEVIDFFGLWIHREVEIRRIDNKTLSFLNKITGDTLTITAQAVKPEHSCYSVGSYNCGACTLERTGPPPVMLSILNGYRA